MKDRTGRPWITFIAIRGDHESGTGSCDASVQALQSSGAATEPAIQSRAEQRARYRGQIDRREILPPVAFNYHAGLVSAVQDQSAHRLRDGMVQVALTYE